jgi:hypothetical protein
MAEKEIILILKRFDRLRLLLGTFGKIKPIIHHNVAYLQLCKGPRFFLLPVVSFEKKEIINLL